MLDWRNFTFEYSWHVLAAFGMNRGRMSSRNQTTTTGARDWEGWLGFLTPGFGANTVFIDWIYLPFQAPGSPRASKSCSSIVTASLRPGNYGLRLPPNC